MINYINKLQLASYIHVYICICIHIYNVFKIKPLKQVTTNKVWLIQVHLTDNGPQTLQRFANMAFKMLNLKKAFCNKHASS